MRWSAVFDDVELTAADIARLAKEARPLIRSGGRWVAIDRADLDEAAAERSRSARRHDAALRRARCCASRSASKARRSPAAISVGGGGWAADLLDGRGRSLVRAAPARPTGFVGELRSYQAEALAWLGFLDTAGLGGCLALDMGLGKTPTMLAAPPRGRRHRSRARDRAAGRRRQLDRGGARGSRPDCASSCTTARTAPSADEIAAEVADADVVITTYGTAVRDVDAIAGVAWDA